MYAAVTLQTISYHLYCRLKTALCKTNASKQPINQAGLQREHDLLFLNNDSGDWDTAAAVNEQTWGKKEELASSPGPTNTVWQRSHNNATVCIKKIISLA